MSGAWFDLAFEGEGFNVIVTPVGTVTLERVDCTHLTITLDTTEDLKISATVKIAGVVGLTCVN